MPAKKKSTSTEESQTSELEAASMAKVEDTVLGPVSTDVVPEWAEQSSSPDEEPASEAPKGRHIKFMGTADVKSIARGETVQKTLPPLPVNLRFSKENGWTLCTADFPTVPDSWWSYLLSNDNFLDVTRYVQAEEAVPYNLHQTTFQSMRGFQNDPEALDRLAKLNEQNGDSDLSGLDSLG